MIDAATTTVRDRLRAARLYLVTSGTSDGPAAFPAAVDIAQIRAKELDDEHLLARLRAARAATAARGTLLIVNDRPDLVQAAGADGVHLGQDDLPVAQARELLGPDALIGLSTHSPQQIDAVDAELVDYIGVGPVHATPTKPGRPAVGLQLVRYAAAHAPVPFFAIGGIDATNAAAVVAAGARAIAVVRAIERAPDPQAAARRLREIVLDATG